MKKAGKKLFGMKKAKCKAMASKCSISRDVRACCPKTCAGTRMLMDVVEEPRVLWEDRGDKPEELSKKLRYDNDRCIKKQAKALFGKKAGCAAWKDKCSTSSEV